MRRRDLLTAAAGTSLALAGRRFLKPPAPARPTPSPAQLAWHRDQLGLFLHFGVNTCTDREWGDGREDPAIFNPAGLDARQWARAARTGGFRTLILTAKHHDGFCLWPSRLSDHTVARSPWREGRGDVVRELAAACRAQGLGLGLYLSPWDRHEPSYGDSPRYNDFYIGQLTELLTWYGLVREVWFDGANGEGPNGRRQQYDWPRIHATVRRLQPGAVIFSDAGPDIRWIGNERGIAGDPNWCTMDPAAVPFPGADGPGIIEALQHGDPDGTVWRPGEADVSIRPGWFYHPAEDDKVRSGADLLDLYFSSVGRNAGLLLNVPPNRDGLLSPADLRALAEFGRRRERLLAKDLAEEGREEAGQPAGEQRLRFERPVEFDVVRLAEHIEQGQRVTHHRVEVLGADGWQALVEGTTIGAQRLHRVNRTRTRGVRVTLRGYQPLESVRVSLFRDPES